ncbi:MAG: MlrC C-terminal domain-containing protein, partial [Deltaproteobacteria bacterium]|nr:MlrC C-terminal domain-containing protein [Deltaproteobacteria bacterium]
MPEDSSNNVAMTEATIPQFLSADEAIDAALARDDQPVIIADCSDNPGGGSPSDSTWLLSALLERNVPSAIFGILWDPIAVSIAR